MECDFDFGVYLMTGTYLVARDHFTLQENDIVNIRIGPIGVLSNIIAYKS